jgi:hypothetical protein
MTISLKQFKRSIRNRQLPSIDGDERFCNLAQGYWVYDEFLSALKRAGWVRFAPGFKAGLYGHPKSDYCIKVLGMGVGDDPLYFCERGYYLEHEERMLGRFRDCGFVFPPAPVRPDDAIRLLADNYKVPAAQAEMRVLRHDVLIMEHISGIPFATQTGRFLNQDVNLIGYEKELLDQMVGALYRLKADLDRANDKDLLHNDPMPPNIIFTLDSKDALVARLVDFELAQDLRAASPDWVNSSVAELYGEREVPRNPYNGKHTKNLDQHLMDRAIDVAGIIQRTIPNAGRLADVLDGIDLEIPFIGGISFNLGHAYRLLRGARAQP